MAEKLPQKDTRQTEKMDLQESEELQEDPKEKAEPSTRSTPGSSDSPSVVDDGASSSAESRGSASATGAIPKIPRHVADPNKTPDSAASARGKSVSPSTRQLTRSTPGSSDSTTSGVDVRYESAEDASSSAESRSEAHATGAIPKVKKTTPDSAADAGGSSSSRESGSTSPARWRRHSTHAVSKIGTRLKSAAVAIKDSIVNPHFRRAASSGGAAASSGGGDTVPLMLEESESGESAGEENKMKLSDSEAEEKMETSPTGETSDMDDSTQGACGGIAEKDDSPPQQEIELSTDTSSETSSTSDENRRLVGNVPTTGTKSDKLKNTEWSLESGKSSLPDTATTSIDSLESFSADSYEEAQAQGMRRRRENESEEEVDLGGPVKRPAVERRDDDSDEGPSAQGLPLPNVERLI